MPKFLPTELYAELLPADEPLPAAGLSAAGRHAATAELLQLSQSTHFNPAWRSYHARNFASQVAVASLAATNTPTAMPAPPSQ